MEKTILKGLCPDFDYYQTKEYSFVDHVFSSYLSRISKLEKSWVVRQLRLKYNFFNTASRQWLIWKNTIWLQ